MAKSKYKVKLIKENKKGDKSIIIKSICRDRYDLLKEFSKRSSLE